MIGLDFVLALPRNVEVARRLGLMDVVLVWVRRGDLRTSWFMSRGRFVTQVVLVVGSN